MQKHTLLSLLAVGVLSLSATNALAQTNTTPPVNTTNSSFNDITPVKVNKNQFSFAIGVNNIGKKHDYSDAGFNLGLEYTHSFTPNIGLFIGADTSMNLLSGVVSGLLLDETVDLDYTTLPVAVQFTLPLDNNEFFARVGANTFMLDETTSFPENQHKKQIDKTHYGVGFYGAVGWQYNFGLTESKNWAIGLNYQYFRMKNYNVNQYMLLLGYRF